MACYGQSVCVNKWMRGMDVQDELLRTGGLDD